MALASKNCLSLEERNLLASQHAGLVKHIAYRMAVVLPNHVEVDDLIHDGVIGLMEALRRFDPSKGIKFQTFAANRIRGAILDALRGLDWISRGARHRAREMHQAEESLCQGIGRKPTLEELSNHSGLTRVELQRRRLECELGYMVSLDEVRSGADDADDRLSDKLADPRSGIEEALDRSSKKDALRAALETLSERERLVLALYYFEELNIREIGKVLGVSEPRVSQLHSRCIRKLRACLEKDSLDLASGF